MRKYMITADSTIELSPQRATEIGLPCISVNYLIDEIEHTWQDDIDLKDYYDRMRAGAKMSTVQAHRLAIEEFFTHWASAGYDIIHLSLSSGLSGTWESECMVAKAVMAEYPDTRIEVVDTLAASYGQTLLAMRALAMQAEGAAMDEVLAHLKDIRGRVTHYFTVDTLEYLYRGGRVSKAKMVLSRAININPILHCDTDGTLKPLDKARGRKKSLQRLADMMGNNLSDNYKSENPYIIIAHADSLTDAEFLGERIRVRYGIEDIRYEWVGPTIGAHAGPGTIGLFYIGRGR